MTAFFGIFSVSSLLVYLSAFFLGYFHLNLSVSTFTHMVFGISASFLLIMVHCLIFGIFTGAGKDTRLLVNDLNLDPIYTEKTKSFRKKTFPKALYAILLILITSLLGGGRGKSVFLDFLHPLFAWITLFYNMYVIQLEYRSVRENSKWLKEVNEKAVSKVYELNLKLPEVLETNMISEQDWPKHVVALGKFLIFLSWNLWLPFIYLKYIMALDVLFLPFFISSALLLVGGFYLKHRYILSN